MAWIILDRRANAGDVHVNRAIESLENLARRQVHQLLPRQHATRALGQRDQQSNWCDVSARIWPSTRTTRASRSISRRPKRSPCEADGPCDRRSRALTRASSSRGSKGFGR